MQTSVVAGRVKGKDKIGVRVGRELLFAGEDLDAKQQRDPCQWICE